MGERGGFEFRRRVYEPCSGRRGGGGLECEMEIQYAASEPSSKEGTPQYVVRRKGGGNGRIGVHEPYSGGGGVMNVKYSTTA